MKWRLRLYRGYIGVAESLEPWNHQSHDTVSDLQTAVQSACFGFLELDFGCMVQVDLVMGPLNDLRAKIPAR